MAAPRTRLMSDAKIKTAAGLERVSQDSSGRESPDKEGPTTHDSCTSRDLVHKRISIGMWLLSIGLIVAQIVWPSTNVYFTPLLLAVWGVFCSVNALRCGRVHCRVIGPLCLLGAITVVLMSVGLVRISGTAFNIALVAGVLGAFALEGIVGTYGRRKSAGLPSTPP